MLIPTYLPSEQHSTIPSNATVAVINDDRAIHALVELLIKRSGLSQADIAKRMGVKYQSLQQYRYRTRPTMLCMVRLADVVGAKIVVSFTEDK